MASEPMSGVEKRKLSIDFLKHITTLSTGSIVVLATFLTRDPSFSTQKVLVAISIIGFLISILCAIYAIFILLGNIQDMVKIYKTPTHQFLRLTFIGSLGGFSIGVISLAVFVLRNLSL